MITNNPPFDFDDNDYVSMFVENRITKIYSVYLTSQISDAQYYQPFIHLLRNTSEEDTIIVHLNNYGGLVHTGIEIINAIRATSAKIGCVATGPLYSMAPLIALSFPRILIESNSFFMFHDYSGAEHGKGSEQKASIEHYKPFFDTMFTDITKKFLTTREIRNTLSGKDLYLSRDNVMKRLKKIQKLVE